LGKSKVAIIEGAKNPGGSEIEASVRKAMEPVGGLDNIKSTMKPAVMSSLFCTK
jgi:hypothetical protein